jgi:hypothetical protein
MLGHLFLTLLLKLALLGDMMTGNAPGGGAENGVMMRVVAGNAPSNSPGYAAYGVGLRRQAGDTEYGTGEKQPAHGKPLDAMSLAASDDPVLGPNCGDGFK